MTLIMNYKLLIMKQCSALANYFDMYNKKFVLASLLFVCFTFSIQSQVTIGSISDPQKGALLDLKEQDEGNGNANSEKGLILPRVSLVEITSLSPMLTGSEPDYKNLKPEYTGLTVYNVNANSPFEKGIYIWDGTKWNSMKASSQSSSIAAKNGLSLSGSNTVKLGGSLEKTTILNLDDHNLIFNHGQGKIGIGTSAPDAVMEINNPNSIDPLILRDLKFVTDPHNEIDGPIGDPSPTYYNLMISDHGGVIRKQQFNLSGQGQGGVTFNLKTNTQIAQGESGDEGSQGSGGTWLGLTKGSVDYQYVTLPEDGAYVFSFNLFGELSVPASYQFNYGDALTFYISAFKGGTSLANLADIAEIVVNRARDCNFASYSITLTVAGKAGDKIYFKLSSYNKMSGRFTWTLSAGGDKVARRTNMIFWKL